MAIPVTSLGEVQQLPSPLHCVLLQAGSSQLEGGGWHEVAIPVTSLGEVQQLSRLLHCVLLQAGSCQLEGGGWREVAIPVTSLGEGNNYHASYIVYCCRRVAASWRGEAGVR